MTFKSAIVCQFVQWWRHCSMYLVQQRKMNVLQTSDACAAVRIVNCWQNADEVVRSCYGSLLSFVRSSVLWLPSNFTNLKINSRKSSAMPNIGTKVADVTCKKERGQDCDVSSLMSVHVAIVARLRSRFSALPSRSFCPSSDLRTDSADIDNLYSLEW